MLILAPAQIPLKQFPTSAQTYALELERWLQNEAEKGLRYTGSISKTVGKQTFTVHTLTPDPTTEKVKVIDSSLAGIINYPSSEISLATSANKAFATLEAQGWIYSGSYFKKISTSNYTFLVFYQYKKPAAKKATGKSLEASD